MAIATWHNKCVGGRRGHGEGNGTMTIDFSKSHNRFMATSVVWDAVRTGLVTEAQAWAQWDVVDSARRSEARSPKAKALAARNRAIDARNRQARANAAVATQLAGEAIRAQAERASDLAMARQVATEEATDLAERRVIAVANRARFEAERVIREEAAMTAEQRRTGRLAVDQDTSDEVGRILGAGAGVYGGQA